MLCENFVGIFVCLFSDHHDLCVFRYHRHAMPPGAKTILERSNDGPLITNSQLDVDRTLLGVQYKGQTYPPQYFVLDKDYMTESAND